MIEHTLTLLPVASSVLRAFRRGVPLVAHQGGRWSGKTFNIMMGLVVLASATPNLRIRVTSSAMPQLRQGAMSDFATCLELAKVAALVKTQATANTYVFPNGSRIHFFSADTREKAKASGKWDVTFINEANSVQWEIAQELIIGTSKTTIIDFNPNEAFWYHDRYHDQRLQPNAPVLFYRTTYLDNPYCPEKVIREIESYRETNPNLWRVYGEGRIGTAEGLVFPRMEIIPAWPDDVKKECVGIDYGFTNDYTAAYRIGLHGGKLVMDQIMYERGATAARIIEALQPYKHLPVAAESADPRMNNDIRLAGFRIQPVVKRGGEKGANFIQWSVEAMQRYPLCATAGSIGIRDEQRKYSYVVRDGRPTNDISDRDNHAWDAVRYAFVTFIHSAPTFGATAATYL